MDIESAACDPFVWFHNMLTESYTHKSDADRTKMSRRSLFVSLRERLVQRQDSEHQAALIRIAIALIAAGYLIVAIRTDMVTSIEQPYAKLLTIFIVTYSIVMLISILIHPDISVPRRIIGIAIDLGTTTYAIYILSDVATPFFGMYLFNACGNGFRFGTRYLFLSSTLGVAGFTFVLINSQYWIAHRTMGIGLLIVQIVIPMYFASLVRQLHAALERMRTMANHDALTDLPNRHSFYERLRHTLRIAEQNNVPFAVVFVDLDGFKPINDALGHTAGDAVLKSVANRLKLCMRKYDVVARFGGDEFVIILTDTSKVAITLVIRKIITTVAKPYELDGKLVTLTSSAGVAVYPDDGRSVDELIACADTAMYRSKRAGKNCFCIDDEMEAVLVRSVCVEGEI